MGFIRPTYLRHTFTATMAVCGAPTTLIGYWTPTIGFFFSPFMTPLGTAWQQLLWSYVTSYHGQRLWVSDLMVLSDTVTYEALVDLMWMEGEVNSRFCCQHLGELVQWSTIQNYLCFYFVSFHQKDIGVLIASFVERKTRKLTFKIITFVIVSVLFSFCHQKK